MFFPADLGFGGPRALSTDPERLANRKRRRERQVLSTGRAAAAQALACAAGRGRGGADRIVRTISAGLESAGCHGR